MPDRVVWMERQPRHQRRYSNPARYPYLVQWGNPRLTRMAKMRTFWGARLLAALWHLIGRRHVFITHRGAER